MFHLCPFTNLGFHDGFAQEPDLGALIFGLWQYRIDHKAVFKGTFQQGFQGNSGGPIGAGPTDFHQDRPVIGRLKRLFGPLDMFFCPI